MFSSLPEVGKPLEQGHVDFLKTFTKSCRRSILQMTTNAQSGHPGGSLSSLDYLATLYAFILSQTGEKIVVSHGHISPAVYSVLGEMGYIDKEDAIQNFRQINTKYEGHVTRHVEGVWYGTGPLGAGVSAASAFALGERLKKTDNQVFGLMGDGECQEGQVHEMIHFAKHYKLGNFTLFVDYNKVQLTASIEETLDIDIHKEFEAGHWHVIEIDAHDFNSIWNGINEAYTVTDKPVVILGHSIMGKGVDFMEKDGTDLNPNWHGKPPTPEESAQHIDDFKLTEEEKNELKEFHSFIKWKPNPAEFLPLLKEVEIDIGEPITYDANEMLECRKAYGKALLDISKRNKKIVTLTADVNPSINTNLVANELPDQYIECGIAEQHMVTAAGALSLDEFIPFASTYAAFMGSRAKDQARLNDINNTNVKMVSSHGGLSVGEDGPTHQAIDDAGSFLGMFNTMVIEPCDANQTDRIIRYVASHYGNFYVRMGRHKVPMITKEDGNIFYDKDYEYKYGQCDVIRKGSNLTLVAIGTMVSHALAATKILKEKNPEITVELIAATSIKQFDQTLTDSIKKTGKVLVVEDHNILSGLGSQVARHIQENNLEVKSFKALGVKEYQLSGKAEELYKKNGLDPESIAKICEI